MSAITLPTPRRRGRAARSVAWSTAAGALVCLLPVVLLAGAGNPPCSATPAAGTVDTPAGGGPPAAGLFAQPLRLDPGRAYQVGATRYGGPADPRSSSWGSSGAYLPALPDSFAELSVLDHNPANGGTFTFADGNALSALPYGTRLLVSHGAARQVLVKRDIGYGQGPGQTIPGGQPYRLDVWWQSAEGLAVSKDPVSIQLAPAAGSAANLGQLPTTLAGGPLAQAVCAGPGGGGGIPLPLTPGERTQILPSGLAAAGQDAPAAVQAMVAAGNRLFGRPYIYGGAHCCSLNTLQPGYDCSSAVSYVLHAGGTLGPGALDSTGLTTWGLPGPGRWVTVYANAGHAFMYVAGLRFDTSRNGIDTGPNSGADGPRWRVLDHVPTWAAWTVRHPAGL